MNKKCSKCHKCLPLTEFYGGQSWCKLCVRTYRKNHYYQNRRHTLRHMKEYYVRNREQVSARKILLYTRDKKRILAHNYCYRVNRLYTNINFKLTTLLRRRLNHAIKDQPKVGSAVRDLGCSVEQLRQYLESKFQSGMSWANYGPRGWHIDHIRPLALFDLSDRKEFLQACHYSNLQPLWATDNLKKNKYGVG